MCLVTSCPKKREVVARKRKLSKLSLDPHLLHVTSDEGTSESDPVKVEGSGEIWCDESSQELCLDEDEESQDECGLVVSCDGASPDTATRTKTKKQEKLGKRHNKQSSEKRKEKSRDAARFRRSRESELYNSLCDCLPLPQDVLGNLDKASIMRLAIACLHTGNMINKGLDAPHPPAVGGWERELRSVCGTGRYQESLLQVIDGFVLVLSDRGDVAFVSSTVATYLGLAQVDVLGVSLFDLVHQCDHEDLRHLLCCSSPFSSKRSSCSSTVQPRRGRRSETSAVTHDCASVEEEGMSRCDPRHGFVRMKCTLANRGRNVTIRNASYKVVELSGKMIYNRHSRSGAAGPTLGWLVCLASPVPHPSNIEVPLDKQTYFSKHTPDMKFTYADENFPQFCGFTPQQLEGQSLFQLHHELDGPLLRQAFVTLRAKGQVSTGQYRLLAAGGGYVWLVTQATLIYASREAAPSAVVCLHYVISGVECPGEILSCIQLVDSSRRPSARGCTTSPQLLPTAADSTGWGDGFCGSSAGGACAGGAGVPAFPGTSHTTHNNTITASKTHQQKPSGSFRGPLGVLAGLSHSVLRSSVPSPTLVKTISPRTPQSTSPTLVPTLSNHRHQPHSPTPGVKNILLFTTSLPTPGTKPMTEELFPRTTNTPRDKSNTTAFDLNLNLLSEVKCNINNDFETLDAKMVPSILGLEDSIDRTGPLLSQAAAGLLRAPSRIDDQEEFVSSTASLFETNTLTCEQIGLDNLNIDRYLNADDSFGRPSTADLFADIDSTELSLLDESNSDMDIIDGATLLKNEPFYDGDELDCRAPFLPLCEDENLIMWSPSLELDEESITEGSSSLSPTSCSSSSNSSIHSPARHPSGDSDCVYGPDGFLDATFKLVQGSTLSCNTKNILDKKESSSCSSSMLSSLLQHSFTCKTTPFSPQLPLEQPPPSTCIDPNMVWPGHKSATTPATPATDGGDDEFSLERLLEEGDISECKYTARSPTLASASLHSPVQVSQCASPSFNPSVTAHSSSFSSLVLSCSSPSSPDLLTSVTTKRFSSPQQSPKMCRKRLCSPHVDEICPFKPHQSPLQPQHSSPKASPCTPPRELVRSGRQLRTPHAPYMQQLLTPPESPGSPAPGVSESCVRRLVTLPRTVAFVPRVQVLRAAQPGVYRVLDQLPNTADTRMMAGSSGNKTLLVRGRSAAQGDVRGAYITTRGLKPVQLVSERNIVEYVCTDEDGKTQMKPSMVADSWNGGEDTYEWVDVVEDGGDVNKRFITSSGAEYRYSPATCLLLPQQSGAAVAMMNIAQSDCGGDASVSSDLLQEQDLLQALGNTMA